MLVQALAVKKVIRLTNPILIQKRNGYRDSMIEIAEHIITHRFLLYDDQLYLPLLMPKKVLHPEMQ